MAQERMQLSREREAYFPLMQQGVSATKACQTVGSGSKTARRQHNLGKVLGVRDVVNNQTGGAGYQICRGYNGTNCGDVNRLVTTISYDMTPVNSVVLVK
ncbi:hypothetical protein ACIPW9_24830 [Streptomyces sp. NPDC090052]|uniref:hypothetical protein n=1 Tax=Streptomyces sp. NPDC090052 TaxID=3365931 RepID=UPI00382BB7DD